MDFLHHLPGLQSIPLTPLDLILTFVTLFLLVGKTWQVPSQVRQLLTLAEVVVIIIKAVRHYQKTTAHGRSLAQATNMDEQIEELYQEKVVPFEQDLLYGHDTDSEG